MRKFGSISRLGGLLLASLLSACGGGGGGAVSDGSGGSLALTPPSLTFTVSQNAALPPAQNLMLSWSEADVATIYVTFLPGTALPHPWLTFGNAVGNTSPVIVPMQPSVTSLAPATRTETIRAVSVRADGSVISIRDMTVTYTITP